MSHWIMCFKLDRTHVLYSITAVTLLPFLTTAKDAPAVVEMVERVSC